MNSFMNSLVRPGAVRLYLGLARYNTIAEAAKNANVSRQHATKLLQVWRTNGFIKKNIHEKYDYTQIGEEVANALHKIVLAVG